MSVLMTHKGKGIKELPTCVGRGENNMLGGVGGSTNTKNKRLMRPQREMVVGKYHKTKGRRKK